ncbi:MAG: 4Fe-4S dicluster domain-containing protein [Dehalococcoidia bacterium]|nr:4Fe-4S dicluster domain-containing protein [Dehalococcoidia bacterium]
MAQRKEHKWGMVIDIDKCTGCQACVVACQSENNVGLNTEDRFHQRRAIQWIRVERYWEVPAEYRREGADEDRTEPADAPWHDVKARFIPILCQHCENAPCEPVCPVYATYHNDEGLNVQVYNRCVGTRYCANNCPYQVRYFNFWEPTFPDQFRNQLNPDVTVRSRGIMEKCSFCVQRIRRGQLKVEGSEGGQLSDKELAEGNFLPACVQACPTNTLIFGDYEDPDSRLRQYVEVDEATGDKRLKVPRAYQLLKNLGTEPNVIYLKKIDPQYEGEEADGH